MLVGGSSGARARERLGEALPGAKVDEPHEDVFDVVVEAESREQAVARVWNGIAVAGADDQLGFAERLSVPEHWRKR